MYYPAKKKSIYAPEIQEDFCIFDVETTGLKRYYNNSVFAYSILYKDEIIINRIDRDNDFYPVLNYFLNNNKIIKVGHNMQFDYGFVYEPKLENMPLGCTLLLSQLLFNIEVSHSLDFLIDKYCYVKEFSEIDRQVAAIGKKYGYQNVPVDLFDVYQKNDSLRGLLLWNLFYPEILKDKNLFNVYRREIDLIKVTVSMERAGFNLSIDNTRKLLKETEAKFNQVQLDTFALLGTFINLHSSIQVQELLFNKLKLPVLGRTKEGNPVIDKDALLEYKSMYPTNKVIDLIIKWRTYQNTLSILKSYLEAFQTYGRIHTHIKQNQAVTGRQSSSDPNLHNIQKKEALKNLYPTNSRLCFIPDTGYFWLFFDYKGIEIRLITEVTGEELYYDFIVNGTGDPHTYAAEVFFGELFTDENTCIKNLNKINQKLWQEFIASGKDKKAIFKRVRKILRDAAKNGQFAIAYGARLRRICKTLNMPYNLMEPGYYNFEKVLPKIFNYSKTTTERVLRDGYVRTPYGRILYANPYKPYVLSNAIIQSTAADILKDGERNVYRFINGSSWKRLLKIQLTVHDELILSCKNSEKKHIPEIVYCIGREMTNIDKNIIKIPMQVSCKMSDTSWGEAVELEYDD